MEILKVSAESNPKSVAGALAVALEKNGHAELQAIGPRAVNQAVKAIAIARGYLAPAGTDISAVPSFVHVDGRDGERTTGIRFQVSAVSPDGNQHS